MFPRNRVLSMIRTTYISTVCVEKVGIGLRCCFRCCYGVYGMKTDAIGRLHSCTVHEPECSVACEDHAGEGISYDPRRHAG